MLRQAGRRIGKQEDPDGANHEGRRRKVLRVRAQASNSCGGGQEKPAQLAVQPAAGGAHAERF